MLEAQISVRKISLKILITQSLRFQWQLRPGLSMSSVPVLLLRVCPKCLVTLFLGSLEMLNLLLSRGIKKW